MRISDCEWVPADRHQTWHALLDPEVMQKCLPGCIQIEQITARQYHVVVQRGRSSAPADRYEGDILLSDLTPGQNVTVAFESKGASQGLIIGIAEVKLDEKENGTRLSYSMKATAGGKLAQWSDDRLASAAQATLARFMTVLGDHLGHLPPVRLPPKQQDAELPSTSAARLTSLSWIFPILIVLALAGYHTFFR